MPCAGCRRSGTASPGWAGARPRCGCAATGRRSSPPAPASAGRRASASPAARSTSGLLQRLLHREVEQLVVGNAAPQEERQPRRQIEIADAIRRIRRSLLPAGSRIGTGTSGSSGCCESPSRCPLRIRRSAAPPRYAVSGACRSSSVTGRRYARRASVEMIFLAHAVASSSACRAEAPEARTRGLHVRMRRRLAVSPIVAVAG